MKEFEKLLEGGAYLQRERIATAALQGILSNPHESAALAKHAKEAGDQVPTVAARVAKAMADALIAELDKEK